MVLHYYIIIILLYYMLQEQTARKMKQETMAQLSAKQHKLDMVRNIINQDSDNGNAYNRLRSTGWDDDDDDDDDDDAL